MTQQLPPIRGRQFRCHWRSSMFKVQKRMCATCIYRPNSPLDLAKLENEIRGEHGGFKSFRICHHSESTCCRGFWEQHKNEFQLGQIAQRLNMVEFVEIDTLKGAHK